MTNESYMTQIPDLILSHCEHRFRVEISFTYCLCVANEVQR